MKIVNMKNFPPIRLGNTGSFKQYCGFAIINENGEFLSLDGKEIYIPRGNTKALKPLLPIANTFDFVPYH